MNANNETAAATSPSYEAMLLQVERLVGEIAGDQCNLDEMVAKVEEGYGLIKALRQRLSDTKERIEQLRVEFEAKEVE